MINFIQTKLIALPESSFELISLSFTGKLSQKGNVTFTLKVTLTQNYLLKNILFHNLYLIKNNKKALLASLGASLI